MAKIDITGQYFYIPLAEYLGDPHSEIVKQHLLAEGYTPDPADPIKFKAPDGYTVTKEMVGIEGVDACVISARSNSDPGVSITVTHVEGGSTSYVQFFGSKPVKPVLSSIRQ